MLIGLYSILGVIVNYEAGVVVTLVDAVVLRGIVNGGLPFNRLLLEGGFARVI